MQEKVNLPAIGRYCGPGGPMGLGDLRDRFAQEILSRFGVTPQPSPRGDSIDVDEVAALYGSDALRVFVLSSPGNRGVVWSEAGIEGSYRFLQRVWRLGYELREPLSQLGFFPQIHRVGTVEKILRQKVQMTLARVSQDIVDSQLHTALSWVMQLANELAGYEGEDPRVQVEAYSYLLLLFSPFAPDLAAEAYRQLGGEGSIHHLPWPEVNQDLLRPDDVEIVVQINGKVRGRVPLPAGLAADEVKARVRGVEALRPWLDGKTILKEVVIPDRLINIVVQ